MALPSDRIVQSAWYAALYEENCVRVRDLLKNYPQLLQDGWNEDPKRVVEGRFTQRVWQGRTASRTWQGRTALHVGARRGSVDLVKEVIEMFDDEGRLSCSNEQIHLDFSDPTSPPISLDDLLAAKDGKYKLDALAMAVINGNRLVIQILVEGSIFKSKTNPYEISRGWKAPGPMGTLTTSEDSCREQLRKITEEVMENFTKSRSSDCELLKGIYRESPDFNFLPWEEYLFHSTFLWRSVLIFEHLHEVRHGIFDRACSPSLRRFLCKLQDGQGRTALHVAVDEGTVQQYLLLIPNGPDSADLLSAPDGAGHLLSAPDGAGRTPLHRAAAMRNSESLQSLIWEDRIDLNEKFCPWEYTEDLRMLMGIDIESLSKRNGFNGYGWFDVYDISTAFHIAIIHKRRKCVSLLLSDSYTTNRPDDCGTALDPRFPFTRLLELRSGEGRRLALEPLQLAALVGDASILEMLLEMQAVKSTRNSFLRDILGNNLRLHDQGRPSNFPDSHVRSYWSNPWPAIHLAAAAGNFELLKLIMDSKYYDPWIEDFDGNTTLHHAAKGREVQFDTHLIDHISCPHASDSRGSNEGVDLGIEAIRKGYVEREGCIELLLQAGFDIWKTNKAQKAPYPGPDASAEYLAWWYKKLTKETVSLQNTLNAAANAISVTATLVATASYVGPLQPPLGYHDDNSNGNSPNYMEVKSFPVRMFIVCDTLSFYLAVASIMMALIPCLPMKQASMVEELRHTQRMVTIAVGFLFPSIICVLLAFAAGSIAVVPNSTSWNHGGLTISTASVGGLICLGVIFLFSVRLFRLVSPPNIRTKRMFKFIIG